jgi:hypothetical protein
VPSSARGWTATQLINIRQLALTMLADEISRQRSLRNGLPLAQVAPSCRYRARLGE